MLNFSEFDTIRPIFLHNLGIEFPENAIKTRKCYFENKMPAWSEQNWCFLAKTQKYDFFAKITKQITNGHFRQNKECSLFCQV